MPLSPEHRASEIKGGTITVLFFLGIALIWLAIGARGMAFLTLAVALFNLVLL